VIADTFFKVIKQELEVSSSSSFRQRPFQMAPVPVMPVRPRRR